LVRHVADHVVVLRDGLAVEQAAAELLFANPQHPYTRELIAAIPSFPAADVPAAETAPADPVEPTRITKNP
jgi:peptide/nickel transport system ATP-binding protein